MFKNITYSLQMIRKYCFVNTTAVIKASIELATQPLIHQKNHSHACTFIHTYMYIYMYLISVLFRQDERTCTCTYTVCSIYTIYT